MLPGGPTSCMSALGMTASSSLRRKAVRRSARNGLTGRTPSMPTDPERYAWPTSDGSRRTSPRPGMSRPRSVCICATILGLTQPYIGTSLTHQAAHSRTSGKPFLGEHHFTYQNETRRTNRVGNPEDRVQLSSSQDQSNLPRNQSPKL